MRSPPQLAAAGMTHRTANERKLVPHPKAVLHHPIGERRLEMIGGRKLTFHLRAERRVAGKDFTSNTAGRAGAAAAGFTAGQRHRIWRDAEFSAELARNPGNAAVIVPTSSTS